MKEINKYVMCDEPSPDLTIEMASKMIDEVNSESQLATLFAMIHNKAWWIEDEIYALEPGTDEYKNMDGKIDMWFSLSDKLKNKIFDILGPEKVHISDKGYMALLEPFMKRNGFIFGNGWWIKDEDDK